MNKFFRKYNKWLLAIFGSGLMVIFLMPQIPDLVSGMGLDRAVVATVDGEPITREEYQNIQAQAQVVDRINLQLPIIGPIENWEQWYLLVREAKQAGMVGGTITSPLTSDQAIEFGRNIGVAPYVVQETYTNWVGVVNYLGHLARSSPLSDRRLRLEGRRLFDAADVQVVSLKATESPTGTEPTEEQLQAHLDTWGDVEPGEGDHGFGYQLPNRLTIEWMTIPAASIRDSLETSEQMNEVELYKFWLRNENDTGIPPVEEGAEIPAVVRTRHLDELTTQRREEIGRKLSDRLRNPRRGFTESGGFIVLPDDWNERQLSLEELGKSLQVDYGIELPGVVQTDPLIPINEVRLQEGIGLASSDKYGQRPIGLAELVTQAKEFDGTGLYPIQQDVAGPILGDRSDNLYVFRIIDADPARPPASVDEARDQLTSDLKRLDHYEEMLVEVDAIRQEARDQGLNALATSRDGRVQAASFRQFNPQLAQFFLQNQDSMPRSPQIVPGLGEDQDVVGAVLETSSKFEQDGSLAGLPAADRIDVYPSDQNLALVVVQLNQRTPITRNTFNQMTATGILPTMIMNEEMEGDATLADAFTLEALMKRNNYVVASSSDENTDEDGTADVVVDDSDDTGDTPGS